MTGNVTLDKIAEVYQKIRDTRTAKRHAWEAEDKALDDQQAVLKAHMLGVLNQLGGNSVATPHGTIYKQEKIKPSAADWGAIWEWMKANNAPDLVERRLKTTFIKEFMDEHGGALPPGINVHREYEVVVRRNPKGAPKGEQEGTDE